MNSVNLMGRLTADVDLKTTQSGISVCSFSIAVKRPNVKDTTDFINCVAWRSTAEFISKYFNKGKMIGISGVLTSRKYDDQNGNKRTAFEVVVDNACFCESKQDTQNTAPAPAPVANFQPIADDEDLPF